MPSLPTGTVTFLFTDIEGSTALLQRLGDRRYAEVLAEHQRILREAFAKGNGQEIDTQGDAFLVAFSRARDAVTTAVAAQQALTKHAWPDGDSLRVRMGLHTGEPVSGTSGYVGLDVHRAARICAAGHGGQILLSDATHGLVAKDLPEGISLRDLGEHRLKDLAHPHHLFQVVAADLLADFPPIRALDILPNNLPRQLTSFVGREKEMAEVKRLLSTACLVTLTGSGGAGKTRLALQVAADVVEGYRDGVWLAEFAPISDPALAPKTVASALSVPEQPGRGMTETLVDSLRSKSLLLILDNCEHLLAACADLAAALLRACPRVRILATSREGLGVPGETLWRVPSLSLPDVRRLRPSEDLVLYEAVRLFVDRAVAAAPGFTVTRENAAAVAQVCQQLDGIPLAIELAAARVKVLAVEQIGARLDDRFRLLTGGSRMVLPRHQTLRAAMDWSHDLLSERERVLLRRLTVFAGGWTLEAAEAVCVEDPLMAADVLDVLTQLIDKSLVVVDARGEEVRYRLLETVRQYGLERLRNAAEERTLRRRQRDWYLAFAESAEPKLQGPDEVAWLQRLETEHDNLRTALEWSKTEEGSTDAGLRLAGALWDFWVSRSYLSEGRAWLEEMASLSMAASPLLKAKVLNGAGVLAHKQGDYEGVLALCQAALTLAQAQGDKPGSAMALHYLSHAAQARGDYALGADLIESSMALYREAGDKWGIASMINCLADAERLQGNYKRAGALLEEALSLRDEMGTKRGRLAPLHNLGHVMLRLGNRQRAAALFTEYMAVAHEMGATLDKILGLAAFGGLLAEVAPERAARLLGAADALLAGSGAALEPVDRLDFDRNVAMALCSLGEDALAAAWAKGRAMTLEQAIEYALATGTT